MEGVRGKDVDENGKSSPTFVVGDKPRTVKIEPTHQSQHSLVRPITPDEEIPLDYVESEDPPLVAKQLKREIVETIETTASSSDSYADDKGNGNHNSETDPPQSPDYDEEEAEIDDIICENLELRSLNDGDDEEIGEEVADDGRTEAVSDDEALLPDSARRPRTPLSPCPDDLSGPDDDEEGEDVVCGDAPVDDIAGPSDRSERRRRSRRGSGTSTRCPATGANADADAPVAYRRSRRRTRGGRRVRMRQIHAMRAASTAVVVRRTVVDARILANRRQRLMRLREAHDRRLAAADVGRSGHSSSRFESSSRGARHDTASDGATQRRIQSSRWQNPALRRNPSYYPGSSSSTGRSRSPAAFSSHRRRSPALSRVLTPPRRAAPLDRRIPVTFPSRSHRSRSPRDRLPYRQSTRRSPPASSSFAAPRYAARRSPPLVSRYPPVDPRNHRASHHPRDSAPPLPRGRYGGDSSSSGDRIRHAALPPVAFNKRWRCPKREKSPE